jgi:hypothetical protein
MLPARSICIRPLSKLGGKDLTLRVDDLNRGRSFCLNSEDSASHAVFIDQDELLSPDILRRRGRLRVDGRRSGVARSEAADETSGQG